MGGPLHSWGHKVKIVAAAIIVRDRSSGEKEVLIAKRAPKFTPDENLDGFWEFIGGKVDPEKDGGDPQRCVVREVKEEVDIDITILEVFRPRIHDYGESSIGKVELHFFLCKLTDGFPQPKVGIHDAIAWVPVSDLKNYKHLAGGHTIIDEICRRFAES